MPALSLWGAIKLCRNDSSLYFERTEDAPEPVRKQTKLPESFMIR